MGAYFDQCDATRTCPVCGHPVKAYDGGAGARMLACTGGTPCTWAIARGVMPLPVITQMLSDRKVQTQREHQAWLRKEMRDGQRVSAAGAFDLDDQVLPGRAPIFESSGTDVKDEARTVLRKREGAIADGRPVFKFDRPSAIRGGRGRRRERLPDQRPALA